MTLHDGTVAQAPETDGETDHSECLTRMRSDERRMAGAAGLPFVAILRTARLIFIAAAVSQSWICTQRLPLKRVRLRPCSSLARPKVPSIRVLRSAIRRLPTGLASRSSAASTNTCAQARWRVLSLPEGAHWDRKGQVTQAPFGA